jgi:hypothetical protein
VAIALHVTLDISPFTAVHSREQAAWTLTVVAQENERVTNEDQWKVTSFDMHLRV